MERISFANQVAIVTGAGRGIGQRYALDLARRGASVVVNDIGLDDTPGRTRAENVVEEIRAGGGRAVASGHDVRSATGGAAIAQLALDEFGAIDIVINNAGFLRRAMFADVSLDDVRDIIDVHLLGAFNVTQPAWRTMASKGYGRIIMTSSAASFGMQGNSNYVAAKAGLLGLVSALALEGESLGIRVNGILPFATSMIQADSPAVAVAARDAALNVAMQRELGDRATMNAVAAAALYLASDQCSVTGQCISALAGRYAKVSQTVTEGWLCQDVEAVSPEDIRENLARVLDGASRTDMTSMSDEFAHVLDRVRALRG